MLVYEVKHFSLVNISIGSFMKVNFSVAAQTLNIWLQKSHWPIAQNTVHLRYFWYILPL